MAEAIEVVLALCDAASGAEGSCTDWRTPMLLVMGVAKVADIAADWVVVVKLLLGGDVDGERHVWDRDAA